MFSSGIIKGTVHLSKGLECADVEIINSFDDPFVFGNHRSHGQYLALTGDVEGLIKQVVNYKTQHLFFKDKFQGNGIQGGLTPVAVGMAHGFRLKGINRRALCFIGDGTTGQGVLYEALNLASILDAPVTFVMYDNGYSMDKTVLKNNPHIWAEGIRRTFGITVSHDKLEMSEGPELHVRTVTRLCGHSCNDTQVYRPKEERTQAWIDYHDPINTLVSYYPVLYEQVKEETNKRIDYALSQI